MEDMTREEAESNLSVLRRIRGWLAEVEEGDISAAIGSRITDAERREAFRVIAGAVGTTLEMFSFWEEGKPVERLREAVDASVRLVERRIREMRSPDNLAELLDGREAGCVFIPTGLLRALWRLGDAELRGGPAGPEASEVAELAKKWVERRREAWGAGEGTQLCESHPEPPF